MPAPQHPGRSASRPANRAPPPLLVLTSVATRDQAQALARALVELRLAACAQISQIESVYRWQGAIESAGEFRVLFKTTARLYAQVESAIRERHPYELPAIHAIATTQAFAPYAEWVQDSVGASLPPDDATQPPG